MQVSVRTQLTIIVASVIPFAILAVAIVVDGGPGGNTMSVFDPANVAEGGSIFNGLLFAILMFVGFELAAALGEETAEPARSIPIAIIATIGIVGVLYVVTQYVGTIGSGGPDELPFDFAVLAEVYVGRWLGILVELAVILDIVAVGIGFAAATSRGLFTVARDGLLPRALTAVNRRDVPTTATLTVGAAGLAVIVDRARRLRHGRRRGVPRRVHDVPRDLDDRRLRDQRRLRAAGDRRHRLLLATGATTGGRRGRAWSDWRRPPIGVAAQFIDATAPVGDARWGRHLGILVLAAVAVWVGACMATRPAAVAAVGERAVRHGAP